MVTDVSNDCGAFIYKSQTLFLDEHTTFLENVGKCSPNDAASHPRRLIPSATPLCLGFVINSQAHSPALQQPGYSKLLHQKIHEDHGLREPDLSALVVGHLLDVPSSALGQ